MAVIKNEKQDSEQKVDKKATNKVEEGPKTRAKNGQKGRKTRAFYGCPKWRKGSCKTVKKKGSEQSKEGCPQ